MKDKTQDLKPFCPTYEKKINTVFNNKMLKCLFPPHEYHTVSQEPQVFLNKTQWLHRPTWIKFRISLIITYVFLDF